MSLALEQPRLALVQVWAALEPEIVLRLSGPRPKRPAAPSLIRGFDRGRWWTEGVGSVPTTHDPNASGKASRYKWEPYRDTNWQCIYYFLPRGGHIFAKISR